MHSIHKTSFLCLFTFPNALYGFRAKYLRPVPKSIIMVNGSNFA